MPVFLPNSADLLWSLDLEIILHDNNDYRIDCFTYLPICAQDNEDVLVKYMYKSMDYYVHQFFIWLGEKIVTEADWC